MPHLVRDLVLQLTSGGSHALPEGSAGFDEWWRKLCSWPPNVFALTAAILEESGLYRMAVSGVTLPDWEDEKYISTANEWVSYIQTTRLDEGDCCCAVVEPLPAWLKLLGAKLEQALELRLSPNGGKVDDIHQAVYMLHGLADEACYGVGVPESYLKASQEWHAPWRVPRTSLSVTLQKSSRERLKRLGTVCCFACCNVRILPKKHTPQVGVTLRSSSLYLAAVRGEVGVLWSDVPSLPSVTPARGRAESSERHRRLNLLLVPWPYELHASAFHDEHGKNETAFTFSFDPERGVSKEGGPSPNDVVCGLVAEVERRGLEVDGVVFPELALDEEQFEQIRQDVARSRPEAFVLAGVRARGASPAGAQNLARLALPCGTVLSQSKHHRWCLDAQQIRQYHLGAALAPLERRRYWENTEIGERQMTFVSLRPALTMCHLICEDLARVEPVAEVLRAVGPNLVIALLLDGPQLEKRWPGRYASVLAEDPGSSVLTLTALGMVKRCRGRGDAPSRVVALWKDKTTGVHELSLEPGAHGLLLSLCTNYVEEWTLDGRRDGGNAGALAFGGVEAIQLGTWSRKPRLEGGES